jgi:hypothetical protein
MVSREYTRKGFERQSACARLTNVVWADKWGLHDDLVLFNPAVT